MGHHLKDKNGKKRKADNRNIFLHNYLLGKRGDIIYNKFISIQNKSCQYENIFKILSHSGALNGLIYKGSSHMPPL